MTAVSKEDAKEITAEILRAARAAFESRGYEMGRTSSHYGDRYDLKITAVPVEHGRNGVNMNTPEARNFIQWPTEFDPKLRAEHLGAVIQLKGKPYVFIGVKIRASKRPLLFRELNGPAQLVAPASYAGRIVAADLEDAS